MIHAGCVKKKKTKNKKQKTKKNKQTNHLQRAWATFQQKKNYVV